MGAPLGHLAVVLVVLLGGCGNRSHARDDRPIEQPAPSVTVATAIPEPTPSTPPYADVEDSIRQVVEEFVKSVLAYDATAEPRLAFLTRVASLVTPAELDRLRNSSRARLVWPALRTRAERVTVTVTGISAATSGRVVVEAERTTQTSFATVRDFVEVTLELTNQAGTLQVDGAEGGGL